MNKYTKEDILHYKHMYDIGTPVITDEEYDKLILSMLKSNNEVEIFESLKSIESVYSIEEVRKNINIIYDKVGEVDLVIEPKIDGISALIKYVDGNMVEAISKGGILENNKITDHVKKISNLPLKVSDITFEVRGEICIENNDFKQLKDNFSSSRNAAAGAIYSKDTGNVINRKLKFVAFNFINTGSSNYIDDVQKMKHYFDIIPQLCFYDKNVDLFHLYDEISHNCKWLTDGLVIKVIDYNAREKIGSTNSIEKWMVAFKHFKNTFSSTVKEIEFSIGRQGSIIPVAIINPIKIENKTINKVSCSNMSKYIKFRIGVGSVIEIALKSDAIPVLESVISNSNSNEFIVPVNCPSCFSTLKNDKCISNDCIEKNSQQLEFMFKQCGIKNIGNSLCKKLIEKKINSLSKIFSISLEELQDALNSKLIGEKVFKNILLALKKCKAEDILVSQGIPMCNRSIINRLSKKFSSLKDIIDSYNYDTFIYSLGGNCKKAAESLHLFFSDKENWEEIKKIIEIKDFKFS